MRGGRCAFSARKRSPADREPLTAPMHVPTTIAQPGTMYRRGGTSMWIEKGASEAADSLEGVGMFDVLVMVDR